MPKTQGMPQPPQVGPPNIFCLAVSCLLLCFFVCVCPMEPFVLGWEERCPLRKRLNSSPLCQKPAAPGFTKPSPASWFLICLSPGLLGLPNAPIVAHSLSLPGFPESGANSLGSPLKCFLPTVSPAFPFVIMEAIYLWRVQHAAFEDICHQLFGRSSYGVNRFCDCTSIFQENSLKKQN